jgi:hypothetical protein
MRALAVLSLVLTCAAAGCVVLKDWDQYTSGTGGDVGGSAGLGGSSSGGGGAAGSGGATAGGGTPGGGGSAGEADSGSDAPEDSAPTGDGGFLCGTGTVDDCASCPGAPLPCVTCDGQGNKSPLFCAPIGATCRQISPGGAFTNGCPCSNAGTCPFDVMVCHSGQYCHTCGETQSDNETCKGGGTCNAGTAQCN